MIVSVFLAVEGLRPAMINKGQVPKEKEFSRACKHDLSSPPHQKSFATISLENLGGSKIYILPRSGQLRH
ncbi:hypothetical protein Peur_019845 [Populus x canadensis]